MSYTFKVKASQWSFDITADEDRNCIVILEQQSEIRWLKIIIITMCAKCKTPGCTCNPRDVIFKVNSVTSHYELNI